MRVLFHAVDGTGLGHLVRTGLLSRALWNRVSGLEVLVATNAADDRALLEVLGEASPCVRRMRLPYTNLDEVSAGDDPTPRQVNAHAFLAAARSFEPDLVVFDTHVPSALAHSPILLGAGRALVLRTLTSAAAQRLVAQGVAAGFDLLCVPEDLGAPPLPPALKTPPLGPRVRHVGPLLRPPADAAAKAQARRAFGVAIDESLVVATLGGGGGQLAPGKRTIDDDAGVFAVATHEALTRFAAAHPNVRCLLQVGTYAAHVPAGAAVTVVRADPQLPALIATADIAITLGGYNTTWEVARARVPAIFLIKRSRHESQAARAGALFEIGGAAAVLDGTDVGTLHETLTSLWNNAPWRERIRSTLGTLVVGDGVADAADALLHIARASLPRLSSPPPCESPCEACPVPGPDAPAAADAHPVDGFSLATARSSAQASASDGIADPPGTSSTRDELAELVVSGARRVLVSCSEGRGALSARLQAVRDAGLVPVLESTGRMAAQAPAVREAIAAGTPARLLVFGAGKKLHQRACGQPGSFGQTRALAEAAEGRGASPTWRLCTQRLGVPRQDAVTVLDRRVLHRSAPPKDALPAAVFLRKRWLPYSEIFVHNEVTSLRRYRPVGVCKDTDGERMPGVPLVILGDVPPDRAQHALRAAGATVFHAVFATCATSFLRLVEVMDLPLLVSVRGHDLYREPRRALGPVFALARRLLARTPEMAADLVDAGAPAEKVVVVPTGIDVGALPFRPSRAVAGDNGSATAAREEVRVAVVGRFTAKKGILDAMDAFAEFARQHPSATLDVYGLGHIDEDPAIVAAARARCARGADGARMHLHRAVPRPVLMSALARSDVFLSTSRVAPDGDREGLPNALKEAMAIGLPVVATDHGAIGALVRGDGAQDCAGLVVPEGDVTALARALRELTDARASWPKLASCGRRRIEADFALSSVTATIESLYDAVRREQGG